MPTSGRRQNENNHPRRDADICLLRTLSKDLQRNVKERSSPRIRGKKDKGL
ncbi:hypothetical protein FIBSPDRAFT_858907, partial [Athelia psychrophila]